ncbi:hypothetical protein N7495_002676 [Penicillium taxi]|uniref:uncharacterized protein n=1 Tax=Penicillium taxi TaxID=168475 RepID=UPI002545765D|nr:uncharacterized protein N7495_002676 [Penicillium taxi]KAJ5902148.1 hypothetical protein N7495_002676 [Penicillium taxi]
MYLDVEKAPPSPSLHSKNQLELDTSSATGSDTPLEKSPPQPRYQKWIASLKSVETGGIERISLEDRQPVTSSTTLHMFLMWFSMVLATNNIIVGSLGTYVMGLSFRDAAICAMLGNLVGLCTAGYMSTWGPRSGNRTLIVSRYFMGYWPSKICCLLNILTNIGYCMLNCTVGGQILSKVSGETISVMVGIVIVALTSWVMAMFGMRVFAIYERFAWVPQIMVLCIMLGSAGPHFDFNINIESSPEHLSAKRVTFFSLCVSVGLSWAPLAADYYVYYPPHVKRWKTFLTTVTGGGLAMGFTLLLGNGLGTMLASTPAYVKEYGNNPGGLLMMAYDALGGFGKFCAVINVLALVANNTPGAYSMGMNFQMLGGVFQKVSQPIFTTLTTVAYTACAMGGRNSLYEIFNSLLPLIGYWVIIWFMIVIEEDIIFRRIKGYDWTAWNSPCELPIGIAAGIAFLIGWAGAIIGMDQSYYSGILAQATGGSDLGIWMGAAFTVVSFPPLRALELWFVKR